MSFAHFVQVKMIIMMAKDDHQRSILAAAVESGSTDVFEDVLSTILGYRMGMQGYPMEEVRPRTVLINL